MTGPEVLSRIYLHRARAITRRGYTVTNAGSIDAVTTSPGEIFFASNSAGGASATTVSPRRVMRIPLAPGSRIPTVACHEFGVSCSDATGPLAADSCRALRTVTADGGNATETSEPTEGSSPSETKLRPSGIRTR